jgi:hypothetical protein
MFNLVMIAILSDILVMVKVFNVTFNNISVISWRSVLLVKKTICQKSWQTTSHNVVSSTPRHE